MVDELEGESGEGGGWGCWVWKGAGEQGLLVVVMVAVNSMGR